MKYRIAITLKLVGELLLHSAPARHIEDFTPVLHGKAHGARDRQRCPPLDDVWRHSRRKIAVLAPPFVPSPTSLLATMHDATEL